ncbi:uncharacterized protein DUF3383 [Orbus hercynius]|uniref:Uncharacterized protein DUF3383 n=1 Tax=Orbus hercynius TaxID=593135 RepID=A0A495RHL2_9GAMM|nr:DUF3383 family protein [Orbus hercynius]RKS86911.1 uncharacterized protein DUF3383 [Orbus hercynius]
MSLPINQVVNVSVEQSAAGATKRDMSVIAIFTDETGSDFYNDNSRYVVVTSADDVANRFGANSRVYQAAKSLFAARPKLKTALIAKYVKNEFTLAATQSKLLGSYASTSYVTYKQIDNGYFSFMLNGKTIQVSGLSFTTVSSLKEVATIINEAIADAMNNKGTFYYDETGVRFAIQSSASVSDTLGYVFDEALNGTYIGEMLNLVDGKATILPGADALTLKAESISQAMTALENQYQNWYGAYFATILTDSELLEAHDWVVSANMKVLGYTETRSDNIEYIDSNILKKLAKKNSGRLMVQYNNTGDEFAGIEMMAIALSTVWTGANTAKTVKFKQQTSVTSDDKITMIEATKCKRLGINYYTDYAGVNMLAEGTMLGGTFIDITTGLDAFTDALQVQLFNTLQGSPSKIAQTDEDQEVLLASAKVIGEQFRNNKFLATGQWTSADVGSLSYGDKLESGYYFYSDSFDTQDISDRNSRKMMPIMCALKLAGAGHSVDVVVKYNI